MPNALRGGTETSWQEMGAGAMPALVLHCGLGRGAMWRGVAAGLAERATLTVPDLPGHGKSGPWAPGRDVHDQATDMARSFFDRPMHLIGHSFGGTVALRLAVEAPEKVLSLSLVEPVLFAAARNDPDFAAHRAAEQGFAALHEAGDAEGAARAFNRRWGDGTRWDGFTPQARAMMIANMPFILNSRSALWDDIHDILAPGGLERIAAPVMMIRGAGTVPIVAAIHAGLAARLPNAEEVVIDGAGHMCVASHPDAVAQAVARGLDHSRRASLS
ncbi:alpha/beta fold hydrolase [Cognatishimia sp. F0-27]|uniref:alpha/beta fold hydrolase n=1 Tax=Cognatishimia sp. F0-27 TaxID=2816855 RepID=UPI001D0CA240|nr:alpha/beta hydrolase [Cognatishimia sp. F0-27]MCC1491096.1 alpha/beta hydrolase [Cognatishimia sp. F0-27]